MAGSDAIKTDLKFEDDQYWIRIRNEDLLGTPEEGEEDTWQPITVNFDFAQVLVTLRRNMLENPDMRKMFGLTEPYPAVLEKLYEELVDDLVERIRIEVEQHTLKENINNG